MQQAGQKIVLKAWFCNGKQTLYICGRRDVLHGLFDSIGINLTWGIARDIAFFPRPSPGEEEIVAVAEDPVGSIDAGERAQKYGEPVLGRAMIVLEEGLGFEVLAGEVANSFLGVTAPMNILLSIPVNDYSLIQWREYATPDAEEPEIRTVYVLSAKAVGRVAGAGTVYVCAPLPALGEAPDTSLVPEEPGPSGGGLPDDDGPHGQPLMEDDSVGVL